MTISRRNLMKAVAVTMPAAALGTAAMAKRIDVFVYDSRLLDAHDKQSTHLEFPLAERIVDLADGDFALRSALSVVKKGWHVEGRTRWSDFIVIRGLVEETGARLRHKHFAQGHWEWKFT